MVNPYRGECALTLNGVSHPMRLSLGSLAELECAMKDDSLLSMVQRFETGKFKTQDLIQLLSAGLRGAGWQGSEADLLKAEVEGGPLGAAKAAGLLLKITFGLPE
ncbi:hypothetical protein GCM10007939_03400 [Amylibacter marinus]|uniref:Phage tail tube protein, GTA-gp10 n=1 Tax=Amylibacter marinus TaxID=1475483 RepID=A0ABQ5VS17_9RHOB|nr:gene transfer agent family protein [Amylibacter marinus]GLQ34057.1 hypothetical protein GCM10007939_03400 [Amylibacter marinus]